MIFFTPGPAELYPTVPSHINKALQDHILSLSHRAGQFQTLLNETISSLRKLFEVPSEYEIFFLSSGTECMERIIENCVKEKSCHFVNGAFSNRFYEIAKELGRKPVQNFVSDGAAFDLNLIPVDKNAELVCLTHNETSTGFSWPQEEIKALKKKFPRALLAIDFVSSAPTAKIDFAVVDLAFFSVQKGFGLPAGLAVIVVSPRALEKATALQKEISIGSYHSFLNLQKSMQKKSTPETPNVLGIYLLNQVSNDLLKIGITNLRHRTQVKAKMLYDFLDAQKTYTPFIQNRLYRSQTVVVIQTKKETAANLLTNLRLLGFVVGTGYGRHKEDQIRIANFPAHNQKDIQKLIKAIQSNA